MSPSIVSVALVATVVCVAAVRAPGAHHRGVLPSDQVVPNDNQHPAGTLRDGVLTLRLEARQARWRPERDAGPEVPIYAFAEAGHVPQIPGPLVRVPVGTRIDITLRNALPETLRVYGLSDRPATTLDGTDVAPGSERLFRIRAAMAGTYLYYGRTARDTFPFGQFLDGQLSGALIVDSLGAPRPAKDRIIVAGLWRGNRTPPGTPVARRAEALVFNGRAWPHTERLTATVGDTVRWRVINATRRAHPVHLHGFYFDVHARGDARRDTVYDEGNRRTVVTELMTRGSTMTMSWVPHTPGNWLFHCHIVEHISGRMRPPALSGEPEPQPHHEHDAVTGMSGLVLGIHVRAGKGARPSVDAPRRRMRLFVNEHPRAFGAASAYSFVLQEGRREPARDSMRIPGSTITLMRGEPTAITVINRASEAVSVHWHGLELESVFDGVGGWSGEEAHRVARAIAPGDSFIARITPRRAGTFMYHTHAHELTQMGGGLHAPLIVLEPGTVRDTMLDRTWMLSTHGPHEDSPPSVNGQPSPDTVLVARGQTYRWRFLSLAPHDGKFVRLLSPARTVATWRLVAKDGADLPAHRTAPRPAQQLMATGETYDVEFTPREPGVYVMEVSTVGRGVVHPQILVPLRAAAAETGDPK